MEIEECKQEGVKGQAWMGRVQWMGAKERWRYMVDPHVMC